MRRIPRAVLPALLLLALAPRASAQEERLWSDFDAESAPALRYRDRKGSTLDSFYQLREDPRFKQSVKIRYKIVPGGNAGWGLRFKGRKTGFGSKVAFDLRGDRGGETFRLGLLDAGGREQKISVDRFLPVVGAEWQRVEVPLSEFKDVNISDLVRFTLDFNDLSGEGTVFVDNFTLTDPLPQDESPEAEALRTKVVVDGFERTIPQDAYLPYEGDESTVELTSSRQVAEGAYAMEFEYQFATARPWGSWVLAHRQLDGPLDWTGAEEAALMVKGDGSDNVLRFRIVEESGEVWEYADDKILSGTAWARLRMPMLMFSVYGASQKDRHMDLTKVQSFEIGVFSRASQSASGAKTSKGRITVDHLVVVGPLKDPEAAAPAREAEKMKLDLSTLGNINFSVNGFTEFSHTPEQQSRVIHYASLIADAKVKNFSAKVDFTSKGQEFGEAAAYVGTSTTTTQNQNPQVELRAFTVQAHNLSPRLTNLTLGTVFVDYSPYTLSPLFVFKGISAEGDMNRLNYHGFVLKHSFDSVTAGTRLRYFTPRWQVTGIVVHWRSQARFNNGSGVSGSNLQPAGSDVMDLRNVAKDTVFTGEFKTRLWDDRLSLSALYGQDNYRLTAEADYSDIYNPVFVRELDAPYSPRGAISRYEAELVDALWKGLVLGYRFRRVDTEFKPRYRQSPEGFDSAESDQQGNYCRMVQWYRGFVFSWENDALRRLSNRDHRRYQSSWGVGRYGYKGMDVAFTQTVVRSRYQFKSDRSAMNANDDHRTIANELHVRLQLAPHLAVWFRPRHENKHDRIVNKNFTQDSLHSRLEYFATTNARFFVEHKTSRYADPAFEPQGFPFDDNFFKASVEVSF